MRLTVEQLRRRRGEEGGLGERRLLGHAVQGPTPWPVEGGIPDGSEVVLLLNGAVMSYPDWEPVVGLLSRRYWVVNCDFAGQLLSPGPPRRTLPENVEDVLDVLDSLEISSVHVVGTAVGAAVALLLAASAPERVRTVTLVNGTDRVTPEIRARVEKTTEVLDSALRRGDRDRFYEHFLCGIHSTGYRQQQTEEIEARRRRLDLLPAEWFEGLIETLVAFGEADLEPALSKIVCPALVVVAQGDQVIAPKRSRALAGAIGAELVEHPSSAHALVAEEPEWFVGAVSKFLLSWEGARLT